jgi:hypothetical protein
MNAYRIDMDDIRKWTAIMKKAQGMKFAEDESADSGDGDASIDRFEAKIAADPKARALVEGGGLSPREFAVITMTMLQSALIEAAAAQGANADSLTRATGLIPDNVRFIREHQKEIAALEAK